LREGSHRQIHSEGSIVPALVVLDNSLKNPLRPWCAAMEATIYRLDLRVFASAFGSTKAAHPLTRACHPLAKK